MTEQELERLSALVDDEISENEIPGEINKLTKNQATLDVWSRYHLIGDAMRSELGQLHNTDMASVISQRLENESVVLAPRALKRSTPTRKHAISGLAVAGSLTAVAVVLAPQMINPGSSETPPQTVVSNQLPENKTVYLVQDGTRWELLKKPKVESRLNAYLVNHQDLSPSSNIKGIMPFATFVSYDENKQ
ncbi:MAG: sigma-E factor negative regulatory protein [Candidatus Thiodiazotropha sp. (ex Rostrolucina anterorostrata)]|nr:sigma-E factor negative regulatory protein [Candidatus Thiodiazotropha sp. (ex Rostrolucina anterorostrata)]